MAGKHISPEVVKLLEDIELEAILRPKLEALGVREVSDLGFVSDSDLAEWKLNAIQRSKFFAKIRGVLGEADLVDLPPSAVAQPTAEAPNQPKKTRSDLAMPAEWLEEKRNCSVKYQLVQMAERIIIATGPLEIPELAERLWEAGATLRGSYTAAEWPQFVEATMRDYPRLAVESGVLAGDSAVVSICESVQLSVAEQVISVEDCWRRIALYMSTANQVSILSLVCRSSREVANNDHELWFKLLTRKYPKATLMNPDYLAHMELEKKLEAALDNDYTLAALCRRLENDAGLDIEALMQAVPQQTTPKAMIKFMASHPENFKQSPDGKRFAVCLKPQEGGWSKCKEWLAVNPFSKPPEQKMVSMSAAGSGSGGRAPAEAAPGVAQQLHPKQAFRMYNSNLLSQHSDQSKRGRLEAWEYFTESNSKCTMAPSDMLSMAENRCNSIRTNDPAVVHELVAQTLEGIVYKVPFGYWSRRVRILMNAFNSSQLRIGHEQKKKYERKMLDFMEWVKKERGFGFYHCASCGSRWKSGFSYEEMEQECTQCGATAKPYRIVDLESKDEREARERGEVVPRDKERVSTRAGADPKGKGKGKGKGKDKGKSSNGSVFAQARAYHQGPHVNFTVPVLEHGEGGGGPRRGAEGGSAWDRGQRPRPEAKHVPPPAKAGTASAAAARPGLQTPSAVAVPAAQAPPARAAAAAGAAPLAAAAAAAPAADEAKAAAPVVAARYTSGGGGFFARRRAQQLPEGAAEEPVAATAAAPAAAAAAPAAPAAVAAAPAAAAPVVAAAAGDSATATGYVAGGGGFFVRRTAAAGGGADTAAAPAVAAAPAAPAAASAPGAAPAAAAAAPPEAAAAGSTAPAATPEEAAAPATYQPGGGGFFARRRGTAGAAAGQAADSAAPAAESAAAPPAAAAAAAPSAPAASEASSAAAAAASSSSSSSTAPAPKADDRTEAADRKEKVPPTKDEAQEPPSKKPAVSAD